MRVATVNLYFASENIAKAHMTYFAEEKIIGKKGRTPGHQTVEKLLPKYNKDLQLFDDAFVEAYTYLKNLVNKENIRYNPNKITVAKSKIIAASHAVEKQLKKAQTLGKLSEQLPEVATTLHNSKS